MIRADELVEPGCLGDEIKILVLAGLHDDLGLVGVERLCVADFNRLEKIGRGELVRFLALVVDMQAVGGTLMETSRLAGLKAYSTVTTTIFCGLRPIGRPGTRLTASATASATSNVSADGPHALTTRSPTIPRDAKALRVSTINGQWSAISW